MDTISNVISTGTKKMIDDTPIMVIFALLNYLKMNGEGMLPRTSNVMMDNFIHQLVCSGFEVWKLSVWAVYQ